MHTGITGMTQSGKTTLAKIISGLARGSGVKTAVLDPLADPGWDASFTTRDPELFLAYAKREKSHLLFVDESGSAIGKYNPAMEWLTTTSRHLGHSSFIICHRLTQLSPNLRGQWNRLYLFACGPADARLVAEEWNEPELMNAPKMKKLHFYEVNRFSPMRRGYVDPEKKRIFYLT